ncbi:hypothetical protein [Oscillibacter sp.]|uniref:hypothetical protein n=1 Tax=Oscillibacter sp. TaxID=1945593 RepID=UPI00261FA726|nr:hypothetical protein [Oscillibacter sp.]MDD3346819.1 hypothetical protein [Oscillibacter sp.]
MELELRDGDYVPDGVGGLRRLGGREELLQRVLFRLRARRRAFPFQENLGSRLWRLGQLPPSQRQSAAAQYVAEALAEEADLTTQTVELRVASDGTAVITAQLAYGGEILNVTLDLRV